MKNKNQHSLRIHLGSWFLIPHKDMEDLDWTRYTWLCFTVWVPKKQKDNKIGFK